MSELSYLEKLLDGAEVEWLPLSSLCNLITTGKLNANAMEDNGAYPFFTCNEEPYRINTYAFDLEAILISGNGSQVGHLNYYNGKFNAYQRTYILGGFNENVDIMYLYYYLMHTLKPYIHKNSRKGSVPYITMPMLENFKFPIPCPNNLEKSLAIQSEIVRILDKFTALTAELTAELNMRKKQYNYYRDQLLSFDEEQEKPIYLEKLLDGVEVEWKLLGDASFFEIANNGRKPVKSSLRIAGKTPYYGANNIQDYVDGYTHDGEYVLIAEDGSASLENYSIQYATGKFWANNHVHVVRGKTRVNSRFLFHYLHIVNFIPFLTGGVRAKLTKGQLIEISVPIPCPDNTEKSLAIQAEIVRILDKFDTLTNSITEGLPREIELRQKQYEYYRDLLFSFPKPETVSN
ncbi:restriction endonuclease subunit S [Escherichia coli]|uniref:restriction endonuclease subunit S n=1 Tax=Escherichia coli TaxID=562 RepID=UPI0007E90371|nr:restriction endonuclease subunit S [Escherichia coli]MCK0819337.1 restriction endonuclease subunit S [Escherichia coli]HAW0605831.1 restriction endonuclease subunit S [Escherichia coli]HAW0629524.1 restriction endonuclease subunit S [Escherichia coli]HCP3838103.1 restriction endonuclease subunit S [Escherichia coli]